MKLIGELVVFHDSGGVHTPGMMLQNRLDALTGRHLGRRLPVPYQRAIELVGWATQTMDAGASRGIRCSDGRLRYQ